MVQVFLNNGGGNEFAIAHRLVVLVVVGLVSLLEFLPKLDEKSCDVFGEIGIDFIAEQSFDDAFVIGNDLM